MKRVGTAEEVQIAVVDLDDEAFVDVERPAVNGKPVETDLLMQCAETGKTNLQEAFLEMVRVKDSEAA